MAISLETTLSPSDLTAAADRVAHLAADKVRRLDRSWDRAQGAPVFTEAGRYTSRGWTEWTEGFQYGLSLLAYDATDEADLLELGRRRTLERMPVHLTHFGVHDHGFNTISTFGNLHRLVREGRWRAGEWEETCYQLAIKTSGAVQAARWSPFGDEGGYIYSFNGPHSLFIDTLRTLRVLGLGHQLGHLLMGENDRRISLIDRLIRHGLTSANYLVWYGKGRDAYDVRGRTSHEGIFNANDGCYRCPGTQQGYSPFSTWTRGLAWAMLGFSEQLEFLQTLSNDEIETASGYRKSDVLARFEQAARATCDFYIEAAACSDGICYWDTGAPHLHKMGDYLQRPAEPINLYEPVDASAAAIAAQGLLRLARSLGEAGASYEHAGLVVAKTLFAEPYLSVDDSHQGLLLHSVYHRPNGWDYVPPGQSIPLGESSMWGDYHLLELALLIGRLARPEAPPLTFFDV
ncbi:MAG: glycosyl hydrolase [Pirellulales bacterium]